MKVPPEKRAQVEQVMRAALVKSGTPAQTAESLARVMTEQAVAALEAGRRPEDDDFVTDEQVTQALLRMGGE